MYTLSLNLSFFLPSLSLEPPLPSSNPPKKKPQMMDARSLSISEELAEDEYIPMEPIYTEPPMEDPPTTAGQPENYSYNIYT